MKVAPWLENSVSPFLQASAAAAAKSCSGGTDGVTCGTSWQAGKWDGAYGVGQQMSALEVIQSALIDQVSSFSTRPKCFNRQLIYTLFRLPGR